MHSAAPHTNSATCIEKLRDQGIAIEDAPGPVLRKSRDFYWYSPILKQQLDHVCADFIASPKTEAELRILLATCYTYAIPVTPRGGGTGNYGQSMPLRGGCVLSMTQMAGFDVDQGYLTTQPGAIIADLENAARASGQEIRLFPSTTATATIGGFIAGGSSGVGAARWGGLRNPANILSIQLMTMEAEPRRIELTGADMYKAAHAYGVNGVITQLKLPIDPATDWQEAIVSLPDLDAALGFGLAMAAPKGPLCRMVSLFEAGIAESYFLRHRDFLTQGAAQAAVYIAPQDQTRMDDLAATFGGTITYRPEMTTRRMPALYEIGWNHTTLRAMKVDPEMTYLQSSFGSDPAATAKRVKARFGDELMLHFELTLIEGKPTAVCLPLLRSQDPARIEKVIVILEDELGVTVYNPHRVTLEEGGMKEPDLAQLDFKRETDPEGLLNPGKMIAWDDPTWTPSAGRSYLFATPENETKTT